MTTSVEWIQEAVEKVNRGETEIVVDFASVRRVDGNVVGALEELAGLADARSAKVVLRAVNSGVYRVLKQLRLTQRFRFVT